MGWLQRAKCSIPGGKTTKEPTSEEKGSSKRCDRRRSDQRVPLPALLIFQSQTPLRQMLPSCWALLLPGEEQPAERQRQASMAGAAPGGPVGEAVQDAAAWHAYRARVRSVAPPARTGAWQSERTVIPEIFR